MDTEPGHAQKLRRRGCCCSVWVWALAWLQPGLGMFTESYYIFSTGQAKSIWRQAYPTCWAAGGRALCPARIRCSGTFINTPAGLQPDYKQCTTSSKYPASSLCHLELLQAVSYGEFAGIMVGMLTMGFIAVRLGLKWTSVLCISIMGVGAVLMTASSGGGEGGLAALFTMFAVSYSLFGLGVGGEYPTAAVGHTERHAEASHDVDPLNIETQPGRGRAVQLMFSMQGIGAVVGSAVICIVLAILGAGHPDCGATDANEAGYSSSRLATSWRLLYGLGLLPIGYTLMHRIFEVQEPKHRAQMMLDQMQQPGQAKAMDFLSTVLLFFKMFWPRLLGTSLAWFLWDVCFYGNKLFSAPIFSAMLGPESKLLSQNLYILLNNVVALIGYWFAALVIDSQYVGRVRLQIAGFLTCGMLFLVCGIGWSGLAPGLRLTLYMLTSLWGQLGPNATTYVLPSESFPTQMRTIGHGISAFSGKAGALLATVWFERLQRHQHGTQEIFLICAVTCLLGAAVTLALCCNLTQLDLRDQELQWVVMKAGNSSTYKGEAVNPINLSMYEQYVLKWGRHYSPDAGRDASLRELLDPSTAPTSGVNSAATSNRTSEAGLAPAAGTGGGAVIIEEGLSYATTPGLATTCGAAVPSVTPWSDPLTHVVTQTAATSIARAGGGFASRAARPGDGKAGGGANRDHSTAGLVPNEFQGSNSV